MKMVIDLLCAATSFTCAVLLLRGHLRSPSPLLSWSSACFACFAIGNGLLFADEILSADVDLSVWRKVPSLVGGLVLVLGMIRESR